MNAILLLFIFLPLISSFACLLLYKAGKKYCDILGVLTLGILSVMAISLYMVRPVGSVITMHVGHSVLSVGLALDGLSHMILLLIVTVAFIAGLYSVNYMERYSSKHLYWALLLMMVAGMSGAVLSMDLVNLFIFIELASISSAALVAFGTNAEELEASVKYLVMGAIASIFILLGIVFIYAITGTVNMTEAAKLMPSCSTKAVMLCAVLMLIGFSIKAALMPFHSWLPDAHTAAPAPVSALLSGVLIKSLGIYAIIRVLFNVLGVSQTMSSTLMALSAISIIGGSLLAYGQDDMKRMMACSSISQVGYIMLGVSLATPIGVMAGLFHLFNHTIIKSLLFLTAGSVEYATGTRRLDKLGGLRAMLPVTSNASLIGSLAISGMPPFNAFWSKLFIVFACVQAGKVGYALVAVVGSMLTLAYFLRMQKLAFFGIASVKDRLVKEVPFLMKTSMAILVLLCIFTGLFFTRVVDLIINPAVVSIASGSGYSHIGGF